MKPFSYKKLLIHFEFVCNSMITFCTYRFFSGIKYVSIFCSMKIVYNSCVACNSSIELSLRIMMMTHLIWRAVEHPLIPGHQKKHTFLTFPNFWTMGMRNIYSKRIYIQTNTINKDKSESIWTEASAQIYNEEVSARTKCFPKAR